MKSNGYVKCILFRNYLILIIFIFTVSFLISCFIMFMSVILSPNQEILELVKQKHLLSNQIACLNNELSLINDKVDILNQQGKIKITVKNLEADLSVLGNREDQTSIAAFF